MITSFLPKLVTAISDCVQLVSDECLAKGLIPDSVYKRVLESGGTSEDKARTLILAVKKSTETDSRCLEILLNILEEQLPYGIRDSLLSAIRKEITEKANTCKVVVPLSQNVQLVPTEELPRESATLHTRLLGKYENSIRQHERACTEKNLLEQRLKAKSEKYEKLKQELEVLKSQNQEISSIREGVARAESRISACESGVENLKARIKELEKTIEEQGMQAKRGRGMVTTKTKNFFTLFAKEKVDEQIRIKEKEHKLEIQEKELRIRELEVKPKSQVDVNSQDVLKPANLPCVVNFLREYSGMYNKIDVRHQRGFSHSVRKYKWKDLGSKLGFSQEELDRIDQDATTTDESKLYQLLRYWLQSYPGDKRGSTTFATYTQLKTALVDAGLGDVARDLPPYEKLSQELPKNIH